MAKNVMKRIQFVIMIIIVSNFVNACGQLQKNKNKMDIASVDSILIIKYLPNTVAKTPRNLTSRQIKTFVTDWNNSVSHGMCKYFQEYRLIVFQNDRTKRTFRANGKNIKEESDVCFNIGEDSYFNKLYENAFNCTDMQ